MLLSWLGGKGENEMAKKKCIYVFLNSFFSLLNFFEQ